MTVTETAPEVGLRATSAGVQRSAERAAASAPAPSSEGSGGGGALGVDKAHWRANPYKDPLWPLHLFFSPKFTVHRIAGLAYLFQYAAAWQLYMNDWAAFRDSWLVISLPATGVLMSLSATYYFSFLPAKKDPGYYR